MLLPFILVLVCWAFACAVQKSMSKHVKATFCSCFRPSWQRNATTGNWYILVRSHKARWFQLSFRYEDLVWSSGTNKWNYGRVLISFFRLKHVQICWNIGHCWTMLGSISWVEPSAITAATICQHRPLCGTTCGLTWTSPRDSSWADQVAHSQQLASGGFGGFENTEKKTLKSER